MFLDTKLVAKIQTRAGALAHEAANVLQTYQSWVQMYEKYKSKGDEAGAANAKMKAEQCETNCRIFLGKLMGLDRKV